MILNDNIKLIREKAGLTQPTFAGLFDISVSNLKSYENLNVSPKRPIIHRIAKFAGITEEELLTKKLNPDDIQLYTEDAFADDEKEKDRKNALEVTKRLEDAFRKVYNEGQTELIETLKMQDEALTNFRNLIKEVNEQRLADVKLLTGMISELIKRVDKLESSLESDIEDLESDIYEHRKILKAQGLL